MTSSYLLRPLRSIAQVEKEMAARRETLAAIVGTPFPRLTSVSEPTRNVKADDAVLADVLVRRNE